MLYVFNRDYLPKSLGSSYMVSGTCYIAVKYIQTLENFEIPLKNLSFYRLMGVFGQYIRDIESGPAG